MLTMKHFCRTFLHLFTFGIMLHLQGYAYDNADRYTSVQLWFIGLITMLNLALSGYHLNKMFQSFAPHLTPKEYES